MQIITEIALNSNNKQVKGKHLTEMTTIDELTSDEIFCLVFVFLIINSVINRLP